MLCRFIYPNSKSRYEYLYIIILVTIVIYYLANRLSIIGLGEDVSTNLGLNYKKILLISIAMVSITTGVVASVVGNVPFLEIIVPNLVSMYRGDNLKDNLPYACLSAMLVIIIADLIARTIIAPFEVPVSLILGSIGAIVFLIIVFILGNFAVNSCISFDSCGIFFPLITNTHII